MKIVAIVSGGIDSTVLLHYLSKVSGSEVAALVFDYGQRHRREIGYALNQCDDLEVDRRVVPLPWMTSFRSSSITNTGLQTPHIVEVLGHPQPITYVPFRNLLFLTIACQFAEDLDYNAVAYGAQLHDMYGYWDTTALFVNAFDKILCLNRMHPIKLLTPLIGNKKADNIKLGRTLDIDFVGTYSCYEGRELHCGVCATCAERKKGFQDAGVPDPTTYER
jgi:7-cyano-7-deazaguanine synthase